MARKLNTLVLLVFAVAVFANAAEAAETRWTWSEPTTGSPVMFYNVFYSPDGTNWVLQDTTHTNTWVFQPQDYPYQVSVSGVDAWDREGPRSDASEPDLGPPGQPGIPTIISIILGAIAGISITLLIVGAFLGWFRK